MRRLVSFALTRCRWSGQRQSFFSGAENRDKARKAERLKRIFQKLIPIELNSQVPCRGSCGQLDRFLLDAGNRQATRERMGDARTLAQSASTEARTVTRAEVSILWRLARMLLNQNPQPAAQG